MIPTTQRKLREAQFFLVHLAAESKKTVRNEPEAFEFYLSALLGAGRSVTWVLQYEAKASYDAWFPGWFSALGEDDRALFEDLKDRRNFVQKRGGAEVAAEWEYVPLHLLPTGGRVHPALGFTWSSMPGTEPPSVGIPVHSFSSESGEHKKVVPTCERYVSLLATLVQDFIQDHETAG